MTLASIAAAGNAIAADDTRKIEFSIRSAFAGTPGVEHVSVRFRSDEIVVGVFTTTVDATRAGTLVRDVLKGLGYAAVTSRNIPAPEWDTQRTPGDEPALSTAALP